MYPAEEMSDENDQDPLRRIRTQTFEGVGLFVGVDDRHAGAFLQRRLGWDAVAGFRIDVGILTRHPHPRCRAFDRHVERRFG